ncbi:MAG TPA: hypothetical protein VJ914_23965 [Pseudonocardiaceae bacterium]|nr:hypothetical protein [Pseudonocardiaceae bacterium]
MFRQKRREPYQLRLISTRRPSARPALLVLLIAMPIALLGVTAAAFVFGSAHGAAPAAAAAAPNPNCSLIVPANPLSATGLATPYQLTATNPANGACHESNINQSAFVEAAVITPGGQLSLYDPLVVDRGTQPAAAPVAAQVPAGSTVGVWFGFNGTTLTLRSTNGSLGQGNCVNGSRGSVFGQFAYCNAPAFFRAANQAIAAKTLVVPPAGTAKDGAPCPTTRDFSLVDQDQSDNVVTHYLANGKGQIAQKNNAATAAVGAGAVDLANGSDNLLLNQFVDPALGCTPFTAPDQSSDMQAMGALPLDELSAAASQQAPVALVPLNDPMTLNNANQSTTKTNAYRAGVDQLPIGQGGDNGNATTYCTNLFNKQTGIPRVFKDQAMFQNAPSVDAAMATNLFTFLAMRANQSFTNLGCANLLNMANPITLTMNGNQVVTAATFKAAAGQPPATTCGPTPTSAANGGTMTPPASGTTTSAGTTTAATGATTTSATGVTTTTANGMPGPSGTPASTASGMPASGGATTSSGTGMTSGGATSAQPPSSGASCVPPTTTPANGGGMTNTNQPPNPWRVHHHPHW